MSTCKRICTAAAIAVLAAASAHGKVVLSATAQTQLRQAFSRPASIYSVDERAGEVQLRRVDLWAGGHANLRRAKVDTSKSGTRTCLLMEETQNRPIWPDGGQAEGLAARRPFLIRYVKEPRKRSFVKDLRAPTASKLAPNEAESIATRLIEANKLCETTTTDRCGEAQVISRMQAVCADSGVKGDSVFTLFQRVTFKRQLSGLDVVNSKQIVDLHPGTREILAYKSMNWTPVNEASAVARPFKSQQRVLAEIDSAVARPTGDRTVERVKLCYYLADSLVLPVLAVYPVRDTMETGIGDVVYVGLVDAELGRPGARSPRQPESAR